MSRHQTNGAATFNYFDTKAKRYAITCNMNARWIKAAMVS